MTTPGSKLAWGILSTGRIAGVFARGLKESSTGTLVAVGSRTQEAADRFGKEFGITRCHASYEALLADPTVQAVYIATPHPLHALWTIRAAEAGKHVLCEKPLALNEAEATAAIEAARRHGVFLMEAFMYRCHPQTAKLVEQIKAKAIGEVRVIQATFSFQAGFNPEGRLLNNALGGGGILDVGCYPMSMARLIAGAALGRDFSEPLEIKGVGVLGEVTRVDEVAVAVAKFPGNIVAQLSTGVLVNQENILRIFGTEGSITVPAPWGLGGAGTLKIIVNKKGAAAPEEIEIISPVGSYALEADMVAKTLDRRQGIPPAMTWDDSLGNMRALDKWRREIGLVYDAEQPDRLLLPVHGRPLARAPKAPMSYGRIAGLDKEISRLLMGTMGGGTARVFGMYDDFFELGGNGFDTAYIYGGGSSEKDLGLWIKNRGIRKDVVILAKGAHSPHCNPKALSTQLLESLDRLKTDHADIYMMHRDNPEIPVGEFIDVLNEHVRAGRIRIFGGSNWTIERVEAANAYAKSKGLQGFSAISNNLSLARMVEAPWGGCLSCSDPASRTWLTRNQMPVMSWSSQARGFFTGRADPRDTSDKELVRCWYADDNFKRLARVQEFAAKRKVEPINVALAWVLRQPFPTFPLVGPAVPSETLSCVSALTLDLSPADVAWLNLEE